MKTAHRCRALLRKGSFLLLLCGLSFSTACGGSGDSQQAEDMGSGDTASPSATPEAAPPEAQAVDIDPCTVLTPEDYAAVMGGTPESTSSDTTGVFRFCHYSHAGNTENAYAAVTRQPEADFEQGLTLARQLAGEEPEAISVTGGRAYWLPESRLVVGYKNGVSFRVAAGTPNDTKAKAAALAMRVSDHIP